MKSSHVLFAGGPLDGQERLIPQDPPPPHYQVNVAPGHYWTSPTHQVLKPGLYVYRLQVNPADDGPLWLYVPNIEGNRP